MSSIEYDVIKIIPNISDSGYSRGHSRDFPNKIKLSYYSKNKKTILLKDQLNVGLRRETLGGVALFFGPFSMTNCVTQHWHPFRFRLRASTSSTPSNPRPPRALSLSPPFVNPLRFIHTNNKLSSDDGCLDYMGTGST